MRRQAGELTPAEAVSKSIELQLPVGFARAFADQRNRVLDKVRLLVREQLGAIADRRDRPDQIMTEARGKQLEDAQINSLAHDGMLAWPRRCGNEQTFIKSGFY